MSDAWYPEVEIVDGDPHPFHVYAVHRATGFKDPDGSFGSRAAAEVHAREHAKSLNLNETTPEDFATNVVPFRKKESATDREKRFCVQIIPIPGWEAESRYLLKDGTVGTETLKNSMRKLTQKEAWKEHERFNALFKELDVRWKALVCLT